MSDQNVNSFIGKDTTATFDPQDIEKNKTLAAFAMLLFFLPLIACPESRFGRFYANQGLILFILSLGGSIILGIIPFVGWVLLPLYAIATLALAILGLINGLNGKARELPLVGRFRLIK